ncbi:hypothetical protein Baya_6958 [Bagarius yarrelli]|uniref:Uncharacterized protein n=1 Tax=Bagarius yarrelli TaxID=175774 RepID=A0A556U3D7_BAGYA|nr:hypothetical protein Baya_6958 [Bagarius yarrelli]
MPTLAKGCYLEVMRHPRMRRYRGILLPRGRWLTGRINGHAGTPQLNRSLPAEALDTFVELLGNAVHFLGALVGKVQAANSLTGGVDRPHQGGSDHSAGAQRRSTEPEERGQRDLDMKFSSPINTDNTSHTSDEEASHRNDTIEEDKYDYKMKTDKAPDLRRVDAQISTCSYNAGQLVNRSSQVTRRSDSVLRLLRRMTMCDRNKVKEDPGTAVHREAEQDERVHSTEGPTEESRMSNLAAEKNQPEHSERNLFMFMPGVGQTVRG